MDSLLSNLEIFEAQMLTHIKKKKVSIQTPSLSTVKSGLIVCSLNTYFCHYTFHGRYFSWSLTPLFYNVVIVPRF